MQIKSISATCLMNESSGWDDELQCHIPINLAIQTTESNLINPIQCQLSGFPPFLATDEQLLLINGIAVNILELRLFSVIDNLHRQLLILEVIL